MDDCYRTVNVRFTQGLLQKACLKVSSWQISSVNNFVLRGLLIFFLHPGVSHAFHGPGFSGCRFFRVQVFLSPGYSRPKFLKFQVSQGPGFSGSGSKVRVKVLKVAMYEYLIEVNSAKVTLLYISNGIY